MSALQRCILQLARCGRRTAYAVSANARAAEKRNVLAVLNIIQQLFLFRVCKRVQQSTAFTAF